MFTSDRNVWQVAEDLLGRFGLDGYHEIDMRDGMDLGKMIKIPASYASFECQFQLVH